MRQTRIFLALTFALLNHAQAHPGGLKGFFASKFSDWSGMSELAPIEDADPRMSAHKKTLLGAPDGRTPTFATECLAEAAPILDEIKAANIKYRPSLRFRKISADDKSACLMDIAMAHRNAADQVELELAEDRALWKRIYWTAKEAGGTFRVRQHFQKLRTVTEATTGLVLTELAHIREVSESPHFDIGGDSATPDEAEMASLLITSTFHGSFRHKRLAFINALSANRIQLLTAGLRDEEWSVWTRTDDEQNPPISMPPNILGIDKNDVFLTDRPGTLQASKMEALIKKVLIALITNVPVTEVSHTRTNMVQYWTDNMGRFPDINVETVRESEPFKILKELVRAGLIEGDDLGYIKTWFDESGDIDEVCERAIRLVDEGQANLDITISDLFRALTEIRFTPELLREVTEYADDQDGYSHLMYHMPEVHAIYLNFIQSIAFVPGLARRAMKDVTLQTGSKQVRIRAGETVFLPIHEAKQDAIHSGRGFEEFKRPDEAEVGFTFMSGARGCPAQRTTGYIHKKIIVQFIKEHMVLNPPPMPGNWKHYF